MLQARNFMKAVVPSHGRIRKLLRIGLPIIQAGSNDRADYRQSWSGGVPQGLSYPSPKLPLDVVRPFFAVLVQFLPAHKEFRTATEPRRIEAAAESDLTTEVA
jgi:hypothetical protein